MTSVNGAAREIGEHLVAECVASVHEQDIPRAAPLTDVVHGSGETRKPANDSGPRVLLWAAAWVARLRRGASGIDAKFTEVPVNVVRVKNAKGARGAARTGGRSAAGSQEKCG
jgi:hypothetical protein